MIPPDSDAQQIPPVEPLPPVPKVTARSFAKSRNLRWTEFLGILLLVVLTDVTLYQARGYAGPAAFFIGAALILLIGAAHKSGSWRIPVILALIAGGSFRLIWCGNEVVFVFGLLLVAALSLSLSGIKPTPAELALYPLTLIQSSVFGALIYERWIQLLIRPFRIPAIARVLQYLLPPIFVGVFVIIFVLANPDVANQLWSWLSQFDERILEFLRSFFGSPVRFYVWALTFVVAIGLLRVTRPNVPANVSPSNPPEPESVHEHPFYPACRNTLVALILLFTGYLVFEFSTMWTRSFPPGFYYAGYAHAGAFWLTVALGLATLVLSGMFRETMFREQRLSFLQKLGMLWICQNLLLAIAVYNRLFIYIDFNGMTRMRVVGLLGVSTVVIGLLLVAMTVRRPRSFAWLIQNQVMALGITLYLYAVLPVDAFVIGYDVRQILNGNLKPSTQIGYHETSLEGKLQLFPLLTCDDPIIRNGIAEQLQMTYRDFIPTPNSPHWTTWQYAVQRFRQEYQRHENLMPSTEERSGAWSRFQEYSFQWF